MGNISCTSWSSLHVGRPQDLVRECRDGDYHSCWEKTDVAPFNQLIFSWNAQRPEQGVYRFFVAVRDQATQTWLPAHEVARWGRSRSGKPLQFSLESKRRRSSSFVHVRLELPNGHLADSFAVFVYTCQGAAIEGVQRLFVNTINLNNFKSERGNKFIKKLSSTTIKKVPNYSQMCIKHPRCDSMCSPTSLSMALAYGLKTPINPKGTAIGVYDPGLDAYGSWPFNTAYAFEKSGGTLFAHVQRLPSFAVLHDYLVKKIPVIVSIRGPIRGGALPYQRGHLLVVTGYDNKTQRVICHDPAFPSPQRVLTSYRLRDFLEAWEKSYRLAYVMAPVKVPQERHIPSDSTAP